MKNVAAFALALLMSLAVTGAAQACDRGVYRGPDGASVIVTPRVATDGTTEWRWQALDGRRGSVTAADSPVHCTATGVTVALDGAAPIAWKKLAMTETPAHFTNLGNDFSGILIEPRDAPKDRPLVVVLHGSEKSSALQSGLAYSYVFAAQGISVFTYDKRGTGTSEGDYTQNFELLADDAAAASREARRMAAGRYGRWGFFGGSQGGWIAPRAAQKTDADFVTVGFGLVLTSLEEDREQVFFEMRRKGYDDAAIEQARHVTDATGALIASHFTSGYEQLAAVKKRYAAAPWFSQIEGEFTGSILRADPAELRVTGAARLDGLGVIWHYDAAAVLRALKMPQLWVLAGSDREAPGTLTRERLTGFIRAGKPIDLYVFPNTDHGIYEFVEAPDGSRKMTRVADGYFRLLGDWIKRVARPPYGRAKKILSTP